MGKLQNMQVKFSSAQVTFQPCRSSPLSRIEDLDIRWPCNDEPDRACTIWLGTGVIGTFEFMGGCGVMGEGSTGPLHLNAPALGALERQRLAPWLDVSLSPSILCYT